jgi:hypothetical protein
MLDASTPDALAPDQPIRANGAHRPDHPHHPHSWASEGPPTVPTAASLVLDEMIAGADDAPDESPNETWGHSIDDRVVNTANRLPVRNGRSRPAPTIPEQSKSSSAVELSAPPIDALDLSPIFDDMAFRNLRERLFGGAPPMAFPLVPESPTLAVPAEHDAHKPVPTKAAPMGIPLVAPIDPAPADGREPPIWSPILDDRDSPPTDRPRSRAVLGGAVAIVVVAAAIAVTLVVRDGDTPTQTASGPGDGAPAGPIPGVTAGAATSDIAIDGDGVMQVETHLLLPASTPTLSLAVPDPATSRAAASYDPRVTDIAVTADGSAPLSVADLGPGSTATVALDGGATAITVTYRVTGAVVHSEPSPSWRRVVLATPVTISAGQPIMSTTTVPDATNFGCWAPNAPSPVACGEATAHGWQVALTPDRADNVVVAQVDLPH